MIIANMIFEKYRDRYDGETQGLCLLIADEIAKLVGGTLVAGYLTWYNGSCRREHWWVEKDGITIDPMGDDLLKHERATGREVIHKDQVMFKNTLPLYEQWRIA